MCSAVSDHEALKRRCEFQIISDGSFSYPSEKVMLRNVTRYFLGLYVVPEIVHETKQSDHLRPPDAPESA